MKTWTASILFVMIAFPSFSQAPQPDIVQPGSKWAGWAFQEENDVLSRTNTDKFYTQGLRFSLTRNPDENPEQVERFASWFNRTFDNQLDAQYLWTVGLGQNIYTPDDVTITTPQLNDRHWGGFLYVDNMVQIVEQNDEHARHVIELQTGIVGPSSGARWAQATLHKIIDSAPPVGWPNQLKNEPGINLIYAYDRRIPREVPDRAFRIDLQPHVGASLGNVMTYADAGAIARIGFNNTGFLNGALRATAASNFDGNRPNLEFWIYGGAQGRLVAHNIFLSGGFFQSVPSELETERFVYDLMSGFSIRYRRWRVTYNRVRRSREFTHPLALGDGKQDFGSIVLSVERVLPRR